MRWLCISSIASSAFWKCPFPRRPSLASSKPSTLMETKKFPHAQHLLTEVLVDERAVGKRIHPRLRRPLLRLRVQEKTGGRHKITLQTGKQGHEQIRRDLRAGEKENDMLYSEKMKATDKGGCRPSFKKRKEYLTWTGSKRTSASAALLQRPPYRAWPQSVRLPQMRQMRKGLSPAPAHPQAA